MFTFGQLSSPKLKQSKDLRTIYILNALNSIIVFVFYWVGGLGESFPRVTEERKSRGLYRDRSAGNF